MKGPVRSTLRQLTRATRPLAMRSAGKDGSGTGATCRENYVIPDVATLPGIQHIVVLMMENHSYDNLFGMLGRGDGFTFGPDGLPTATSALAARQPTFPRLPALAAPGDTAAALACSTTGPGTIPPPGSITGS
jgi:hypothetical protein